MSLEETSIIKNKVTQSELVTTVNDLTTGLTGLFSFVKKNMLEKYDQGNSIYISGPVDVYLSALGNSSNNSYTHFEAENMELNFLTQPFRLIGYSQSSQDTFDHPIEMIEEMLPSKNKITGKPKGNPKYWALPVVIKYVPAKEGPFKGENVLSLQFTGEKESFAYLALHPKSKIYGVERNGSLE